MPWGWEQQVSPKRNSYAKIHDVTSKKYTILTSVGCPLVRGKLQCRGPVLIAIDVLCEGKQNDLEERVSLADVHNLCL